RYDNATDQWMRMRVNTSVGSGARLKSLPTYRPSIALTTGLRVELADGTMVGLDRGGEGKWIILDLAYGRLMLVNTGMDPVLVELRVGETSRLVEISPAR